MHELALVQEMLTILNEEADRHRLQKVTGVTVEIGVLANVVPETLSFCFEALTEKTVFEGAELILKQIPVKAACQDCGGSYTAVQTPFLCPQCNSSKANILAGTELHIVNIVGEARDDY
jgi:hydrogenase nickel incorporation protein HypA/HybF